MGRRELATYGWIIGITLVFSGFTWMTRNPDSEILTTAESWPVVGSLAKSFRQGYLYPAEPLSEDGVGPDRTGIVEFRTPEPSENDLFGAQPYVWIQPGTDLHADPDRQSPVVETLGAIQNLSVLSQRGDWYRVRRPRLDSDPVLAWVFLEDYQEPTSDELGQPAPVLPLPANELDPRRLLLADQAMADRGRRLECGLYSLYTNVEQHPAITLCSTLTAEIEEVYRERFGLEPVSPPAETILLFETSTEYRSFRDLDEVKTKSNLAHASPQGGYLALYSDNRSTIPILKTLSHELVHLLNRRALGPALPPWLSEGLADDLAQSRIDSDGSLHPGELGGDTVVVGERVIRSGGIAAVIGLQDALDRDRLPLLVDLQEMDRDKFYQSETVRLHYALSASWVRYLLSDLETGLAERFRSFLQQVAVGRPLTSELLRQELESDWTVLESGFRTWLRLQFLAPLDEIRDGPQ